jgi:hypothetical protein
LYKTVDRQHGICIAKLAGVGSLVELDDSEIEDRD